MPPTSPPDTTTRRTHPTPKSGDAQRQGGNSENDDDGGNVHTIMDAPTSNMTRDGPRKDPRVVLPRRVPPYSGEEEKTRRRDASSSSSSTTTKGTEPNEPTELKELKEEDDTAPGWDDVARRRSLVEHRGGLSASTTAMNKLKRTAKDRDPTATDDDTAPAWDTSTPREVHRLRPMSLSRSATTATSDGPLPSLVVGVPQFSPTDAWLRTVPPTAPFVVSNGTSVKLDEVERAMRVVGPRQPVVLVDLLKLRNTPDAVRAYAHFTRNMNELLRSVDAHVVFVGTINGGATLSGSTVTAPGRAAAAWDAITLTRYPRGLQSVAQLLKSDEYRALAKHRAAGVQGELMFCSVDVVQGAEEKDTHAKL